MIGSELINKLINGDIIGIIVKDDCRNIFPYIPDNLINLVYIDPPFGMGKKIIYKKIKTVSDKEGDRLGFGGKKYKTKLISEKSYDDSLDGKDFVGFLQPILAEVYKKLASNGSFYLHLNWKSVFLIKPELDKIFSEENFLNEIIWAYDFGGRSKRYWPRKHDNILFYVKNKDNYVFNYEEIDRIPYMAPGLVSEEKAQKGKVPTDVWWMTIVPTNSKERLNYPTQKPENLLRRIILASSNKGDIVADFFAGSGTTGAAALKEGRRFILVDNNDEAINIMKKRFSEHIENGKVIIT
jgi:site-specific DNA-methyltransferase (adenine-specific)